MRIQLRPARAEELDLLCAIDDDACTLYASEGLTLETDPIVPFVAEERSRWQRAIELGRAWVATNAQDVPAGFVTMDLLDDAPYLDQISVRRDAMGRGIGRLLLRRALEWSASRPNDELWLTTYRHVPWNRPWYEREGFIVVPEADWPPLIAKHIAAQRQALPSPEERIAMRRPGSIGP